MNRFVIALCVIISIKPPCNLYAHNETELNNSAIVISTVTDFVSHIVKAATIKNSPTVTAEQKGDALVDLIQDFKIMALLMTRCSHGQVEMCESQRQLFEFYRTLQSLMRNEIKELQEIIYAEDVSLSNSVRS